MKKLMLTLSATALLAPAAPVLAEDVTATIVVGHAPVIRWTRMFPESFIPAVESRLEGSGHSLTFIEQYGGTIAGPGEELETMESGLAELGVCNAVVEPDKLSLQAVSYYAPFVSDDARLINDTLNEMNRTDPELTASFTEYGVVYLGGPIGIEDYMLMTREPVTSLEDLAGLKIAAPGAAVNWLSGTGAVGVSGNMTTYYNELKTGVYDGVIVFAGGAWAGKLFEVAPNINLMGFGAQYAGGICANADWFDGLPDEMQLAMREAADVTQDWYMADLENAVATAYAAMEDAGATIHTPSPEMRTDWAAGMDNFAAVWAEQLDGQGKPASATLTRYMDAMRAAGATPLRNWDQE